METRRVRGANAGMADRDRRLSTAWDLCHASPTNLSGMETLSLWLGGRKCCAPMILDSWTHCAKAGLITERPSINLRRVNHSQLTQRLQTSVASETAVGAEIALAMVCCNGHWQVS